MQIDMNKQKVIDNVVSHYLDEMEQYLGDVIAEFKYAYDRMNYEQYKKEIKHIKIELDNFINAINLLKNPQNYWIDSYNDMKDYYIFYCSIHNKQISKK